ncbi:MAG TPA: glycosyltransferase family A protein, partial [Nitrospira sp.]|nr:glycosyltransferase family A protein [Nitrospira sp.]
MPASSKPFISVVLCTHNRANLLPAVLSGLIAQSLTTSAYEIIVVDNASTDDTSAVLRKIQVQVPTAPIRLLYEPIQGLGYARNTGWSNAQGRYVAFIDDDCLPAKNWLQVLLDCFQELKPEPWSVGGKIIPVYDRPKPPWFKDAYETDTWGDQPRALQERESFTGCNMSWRKDILERYGGFNVTYDMKGASLSLAGDTELYRRIWSRSGSDCFFYYTPQAVMHHTIDPYKMTVSYQ